MKIYLVGGAVRDKLLNQPVKERDYVVVGGTEDEMLKLGYQRVGKEFPVFLHPKSREEYALARMERKTGPGYKGFDFDASPKVTLEEDLLRRDLTINAMAEEAETLALIDPYHGQADLKNKLLRHVSIAFAEDPVRILRVGRFLARYAHLGFTVAPETMALMRKMVTDGEVNALVAERVWKELERALGEKNPEKFFEVLAECGALEILLPALELNSNGMTALTSATALTPDSAIRFAVLMHDYAAGDKKQLSELCNRYRIPNAHHELAKLTAAYHHDAQTAKFMDAENLLNLFSRLDIFRREQRFLDFLTACAAIHNNNTFDAEWLQQCAEIAKSYPVQELLAQGFDGAALAEQLKIKRRERIAEWLKTHS
jgi:tRNA nucleotidyltransferase (CCA-adding enzyme)